MADFDDEASPPLGILAHHRSDKTGSGHLRGEAPDNPGPLSSLLENSFQRVPRANSLPITLEQPEKSQAISQFPPQDFDRVEIDDSPLIRKLPSSLPGVSQRWCIEKSVDSQANSLLFFPRCPGQDILHPMHHTPLLRHSTPNILNRPDQTLVTVIDDQQQIPQTTIMAVISHHRIIIHPDQRLLKNSDPGVRYSWEGRLCS